MNIIDKFWEQSPYKDGGPPPLSWADYNRVNAMLAALSDPPCNEKPAALTPDERRRKKERELIEARLATRRAIFRR